VSSGLVVTFQTVVHEISALNPTKSSLCVFLCLKTIAIYSYGNGLDIIAAVLRSSKPSNLGVMVNKCPLLG